MDFGRDGHLMLMQVELIWLEGTEIRADQVDRQGGVHRRRNHLNLGG